MLHPWHSCFVAEISLAICMLEMLKLLPSVSVQDCSASAGLKLASGRDSSCTSKCGVSDDHKPLAYPVDVYGRCMWPLQSAAERRSVSVCARQVSPYLSTVCSVRVHSAL